MQGFLEFLFEQRSTFAGVLACILFGITLYLRYGCDTWWPHGIGLSVACALVAIISVGRD